MKFINKSLVLILASLLTACSTDDLSSEYISSEYLSSEVTSSSITSSSSVHECEWDDPIYTWSTDHTSLTATRVCKTDDTHIETETVEVTSVVTKVATCTEKGTLTYTSKSFENPAFDVQTYIEDVEALGHLYGECTSIDDNKHEHTCSRCEHIEEVNHNYGTYTYDSTTDSCYHICDDCDHKQYEACDYQYIDKDDDYHTVICSKCGHSYDEYHSWDLDNIEYLSYAHMHGDDVIPGEARVTCLICSVTRVVPHSTFEIEIKS